MEEEDSFWKRKSNAFLSAPPEDPDSRYFRLWLLQRLRKRILFQQMVEKWSKNLLYLIEHSAWKHVRNLSNVATQPCHHGWVLLPGTTAKKTGGAQYMSVKRREVPFVRHCMHWKQGRNWKKFVTSVLCLKCKKGVTIDRTKINYS